MLGFKLTDSVDMMEFLRCSPDHHSLGIFHNTVPSLNHIAFEVPNFDGLMYGAGRLKANGFDIDWGVGRHGPGNNIFSYFIEPSGFVARGGRPYRLRRFSASGLDHRDRVHD